MRGGPRPLTPAQQALNLKANRDFPGDVKLLRDRVTWRGGIRPNPVSRLYEVRLEYVVGGTPTVIVVGPDLHGLADGRKLPHCYSQRPPRLCLYLPSTGQWRPDLRLDQTMLPWSAVWFYYFEEWLHSDDWKGGGEHPE